MRGMHSFSWRFGRKPYKPTSRRRPWFMDVRRCPSCLFHESFLALTRHHRIYHNARNPSLSHFLHDIKKPSFVPSSRHIIIAQNNYWPRYIRYDTTDGSRTGPDSFQIWPRTLQNRPMTTSSTTSHNSRTKTKTVMVGHIIRAQIAMKVQRRGMAQISPSG